MPRPSIFSFCFGDAGEWRIASMRAVVGSAPPPAERLAVREGVLADQAGFVLRGTTSNARYSKRAELDALAARQEELGRPTATRAALIPIRKSEAWWALAQDERRAVMEERSRHIAIGLDYLPAVARRLHHGRDLGEPFDFLTWFEYAPEHEDAFETLVTRLRETEEWRFVEHEVDVRLVRD
ncbi:chlorite dismutase family protein [Chenggangzhangella methanolivorans]|uniref:Chlorite dismutase family protein n=1 Tax=Chenggangzhangella methanolivorans TaxID=1437009 RepID=A0A9E6RDH7_9HYPH|nr:chlorite dismutase family protein [Chenggangzhangella methanolivorans]QZN98776.1 chlorite dismutase family protein [Chenggangzhangella methanolivorans]